MDFLFKSEELDRADRLQLYLSYGLRLILFGEVIASAVRVHWAVLFLAGGILLLTLVPVLIRESFQVYLPIELDLLTITFVFAALFLGEIRSYYERFWWWASAAMVWICMWALGALVARSAQSTAAS